MQQVEFLGMEGGVPARYSDAKVSERAKERKYRRMVKNQYLALSKERVFIGPQRWAKVCLLGWMSRPNKRLPGSTWVVRPARGLNLVQPLRNTRDV